MKMTTEQEEEQDQEQEEEEEEEQQQKTTRATRRRTGKKKKKKMKKKATAMEQSCPLLLLPCDLLLIILHRVDYKQIVRLRCVCKFLLNLITNNPRFIDSVDFEPLSIHEILRPGLCSDHHDKVHIMTSNGLSFIYSESVRRPQLAPFYCPPNTRLIGSCNGFLCFGGAKTIEIYSIVASVRFSVPHCYIGNSNVTKTSCDRDGFGYNLETEDARYGFGYNPETEDYNVVCLIDRWTWKLFSVRSREWWNIYGFNAPKILWSTLYGSSICTRYGVICWPPSSKCSDIIVTFNLASKSFDVIKYPGVIPPEHLYFHMVYQGRLTLAFLKEQISRGGGSSEVVLHSESSCGWSQLQTFALPFSPPKNNQIEIVSFDDEIFLLWFEGKHAKLYNVQTKSSKKLQLSSGHYLKSKPAVKSIDM